MRQHYIKPEEMIPIKTACVVLGVQRDKLRKDMRVYRKQWDGTLHVKKADMYAYIATHKPLRFVLLFARNYNYI